MPDARAAAECWRRRCREAGIGEIHLIAALTHGNEDFEQFGFDSGVETPPHNVAACGQPLLHNIAPELEAKEPLSGVAWDYGEVAQSYIKKDYADRKIYRCVFPSWDNAARTGTRALMVCDATPEKYERWLEAASHKTISDRLSQERLLFINAWNEWTEGCHLEPDRKYGRASLEATARVKVGKSTVSLTWEPRENKQTKLQPKEELKLSRARPETIIMRVAQSLSGFPIAYRLAQLAYRVTLKPFRNLYQG